MKASHNNAPSGLLCRYSWPAIPTIGMAKRLLRMGFFQVRYDRASGSCKMLVNGHQASPKGGIQEVQTQKSPELPAPGLNAQNESVCFFAVTDHGRQSVSVLLHNLQCANDPNARTMKPFYSKSNEVSTKHAALLTSSLVAQCITCKVIPGLKHC